MSGYEEPRMEIQKLDMEDVIITSSLDGNNNGGEVIDGWG